MATLNFNIPEGGQMEYLCTSLEIITGKDPDSLFAFLQMSGSDTKLKAAQSFGSVCWVKK